jgi:hypothetical protein
MDNTTMDTTTETCQFCGHDLTPEEAARQAELSRPRPPRPEFAAKVAAAEARQRAERAGADG